MCVTSGVTWDVSGKLACMVRRKAQDGMDNIFWELMSHQIKLLDSNSLIL